MKRNFKYLLSSFRLTDETMFELELATYGFVKSVECFSRVIMIFWCAPQSVFCPKFLTRGIDSYIHILKKNNNHKLFVIQIINCLALHG